MLYKKSEFVIRVNNSQEEVDFIRGKAHLMNFLSFWEIQIIS